MPNVSSPAALPQHIERLLNQRKQHTEAIAVIDGTLARVTVALGGSPAQPSDATASATKKNRSLGNAASSAPKAPPAAKKPAVTKPSGRGSSSKSGMTANEFVMAFVTAKKNPTTQDINKHWKESGRLGAADNNLSILTKTKQLKRVPMEGGIRGSRYVIA